MNVESQFMINRKPCSIYNFYSYFLHVIKSHTMGMVLGKFHIIIYIYFSSLM